MNSSVRAVSVRFDQDNIWVELSDGRTLGVPLAWFPRLLRATVPNVGHVPALDEKEAILALDDYFARI